RRARFDDDAAALTLVPGVGKKTAARLLLDLKSRLEVPDLELVSSNGGSVRADLGAALAGLGYQPDEVRDVLRELPPAGDANEMEVGFRVTSGPALERAGDLAALLTNLDDGDVLFIDEIHRLGRAVDEVLYPAMEDFQLDIVIGKGPSARSIRLDLPRFTLVGATTRTGLITGPLRDRFGFVARLDYYAADELAAIVTRVAVLLGVTLDTPGA